MKISELEKRFKPGAYLVSRIADGSVVVSPEAYEGHVDNLRACFELLSWAKKARELLDIAMRISPWKTDEIAKIQEEINPLLWELEE